MSRIEAATAEERVIHCTPLIVAGRSFGSHYDVALPRGGVLAHPPGAGKTRIGCTLLARSPAPTLILCPAHLIEMWADEIGAEIGRRGEVLRGPARAPDDEGNEAVEEEEEEPHAQARRGRGVETGLEVIGYVWQQEAPAQAAAGEAGRVTDGAALLLLGFHALDRLEIAEIDDEIVLQPPAEATWWAVHLRAARLVVDEPQDASADEVAVLTKLARCFAIRWLCCGTAGAATYLLGTLLLGPKEWRSAVTVHEWRAQPSLPHLFRHRFLRDPEWACLPRPELTITDERVTASREEALEAQVAALSGYVVDTVLLLSFGRQAAALAMTERRQLARKQLARQRTARGQRAHGRTRRGAAKGGLAVTAALHTHDPVWALPPDEAITGPLGPAPTAEGTAEVVTPAAADMEEGKEEDKDDDDDDDDEHEDEEEATAVLQPLLPQSEWSAVEARCRRRLARVQARLLKLRARREREQRAFQLEGPLGQSGVLHRLAFLEGSSLALQWRLPAPLAIRAAPAPDSATVAPAVDADQGDGNWKVIPEATLAAAEWNADLASEIAISGPLARLPHMARRPAMHDAAAAPAASSAGGANLGAAAAEAVPGAIYLISEAEAAGDFCDAAWRAAAIGGIALLVACDGEVTRPMTRGRDNEAPPIPAAMLPASEAAPIFACLTAPVFGNSDPRDSAPSSTTLPPPAPPHATLLVRTVAIEEDAAGGGGGVDEGRMADVVALDDASEQSVTQRIVQLEAEESRLEKALHFSSQQQRAAAELSQPPSTTTTAGAGVTGSEDDTDPERSSAVVCPICLDRPEAVCVLPECFHCLCRSCLQRAVAGGTSFRCPLCRINVESWQVSVYRTARASEQTSRPPDTMAIELAVWRQQPSKLQRLLQLVHTVLLEAPDERVLIYTQWLAHVEHLGTLLDAACMPALRMSGNLGHCMRCLQAFGRHGQPRVLILSSQHHSSGINLQAARNLVLVHPYCTPSATAPEFVSFKQLCAFEQQAIGRIRRYPQAKPVRVWRLVGRDSVEEGLYRGGFVRE